MFDKIPSAIVPVLWMKELIDVDEDTKHDLEKVVFMPRGVSYHEFDLLLKY